MIDRPDVVETEPPERPEPPEFAKPGPFDLGTGDVSSSLTPVACCRALTRGGAAR